MKSKDWIKRFEAEDVGQVKSDFALETRELVDSRTKTSTKEEVGKQKASYAPAVDGAVREQRQKWNAICNKVTTLSPADFDILLNTDLCDVALTLSKYKQKEEPKAPLNKTNDGRKLV